MARTRVVPSRHGRRQAHLHRPVPAGEPEDARLGEDPGALRRDCDHARPRRSSRRRRRHLEEVPRRGDRRDGGAEAVARLAGRERRRPARDQQGRHAGDRRDQVHADERVPLVGHARRRLRRRGSRARGPVRRQVGLLRRRHLRLRRHGADRAPVQAGRRGAADRRLVHDGPGGGRARARTARQPALRAVPLRHLPCTERHARCAREAPSAKVEAIQPGESIDL